MAFGVSVHIDKPVYDFEWSMCNCRVPHGCTSLGRHVAKFLSLCYCGMPQADDEHIAVAAVDPVLMFNTAACPKLYLLQATECMD